MAINGSLTDIIRKSKQMLKKEFTQGAGLDKTPLKAYSGPSLERSCEFMLKLIIEDLSNKYPNRSIQHSKAYLKSDHPDCSDERLDQHILVDGKYVLLQEDRAWIDKPFYTLKRGVVRNIMLSCASKLHENIKFIFIGYCLDYTQKIVNTCDLCQGYGDKVLTYSITGRRRGAKVNNKSVNWYETGFSDENVESYIVNAYNIIEDACK
jgi:hypothetical protein